MKPVTSRLRLLLSLLSVVAIAGVGLLPAAQPAKAANFIHETLPPSLASIPFTDVSVLSTPDTSTFAPAYKYRVLIVGTTGSTVRIGGWNSATQTWRDFGSVGTGAVTPKVAQWWDGNCPAAVIIDGNGHSFFWSLTADSGGTCQDPVGDPTLTPVPGSTPIIALAANSHGGVIGGTSDTNVTYAGGIVLGVKYTGGVSMLQQFTDINGTPAWNNYPSASPCLTVGRINALSTTYDPTTDSVYVVGVGDSGLMLRYNGATNSCTSSNTGATKLTAVATDGSSDFANLGVFAVGSAGTLWSSTNGGNSWSAITPVNPYSFWGFKVIGVSPDLTGIAAFPSGFTGRFGVIVGRRPSGSGGGPIYNFADLTVPVLNAVGSNAYSDLEAVAGVDPTHFWAVGSGGTVLRLTTGAVTGNAWFAPTAAGNGFYTKLSCAVATPGVSCDDPGSNYGLSIEPATSIVSNSLSGQAWIGLADSFGNYALSSVRPPLESTSDFFGPNQTYSGLPVMDAANGNQQNRPTEVAVAGNSLFVGARIGTPAGQGNIAYQPMEQDTIAADGTLTHPATPSNCSYSAGAQDYANSDGFFRLASTTSGGKNWIHIVSPQTFGNPLAIRTADSAGDWCAGLQNETILNLLAAPNGCTYDTTRGDFEAIGDGANLYVIGGHCSNTGTDTNTILRMAVSSAGNVGAAALNVATLPAGFGKVNLKASISDSGSAKALVLFDPASNQIAVGRINRSNNEVCSGTTGTVCTMTIQTTNPFPASTPASAPSAVGAAGTLVLAVYPRPENFNDPALRGHSVVVSQLHFDIEPGSLVGAWNAGQDRSATAYAPTRVTTWKSGARSVAYLGPYFDDRMWAAVDRYDTELIPNAPGWLSFDLADNLNPDTGLLERPPVRPFDCIQWAQEASFQLGRGPSISLINTSNIVGTYDCGGGKVDSVYPGDVWGWARFLGLKRAGELQPPPETDWGWLSLRGPAVSNAQDYTKFSCFSCNSTTSTCDVCQSANVKTETAPGPQPTCSQCSGCTLGATNTCTSCTACRQYGVSYDRSTGTFHGYAWSGGQSVAGANVGLGWVSFEQGISGFQKFSAFVQAQYGDIYSGGDIVSSRGATPFGEFSLCNAFVIQAAGTTISSLCSGLTGYQAQCANPGNANQASNCGNPQAGSNSATFNPGVVTNATPQPFPQPANNFTAPLGKLDVLGLRTVTKTVGLTKYNKYGTEVVELTAAQFVTTFNANTGGGVLGGKIYVVDSGVSGSFIVNQPLQFNNGGNGVSGAGLIIVQGALFLTQNVTYQTAETTRLSQIASAGWIVVREPLSSSGALPAFTVNSAAVTVVSGTFYVNGPVQDVSSGGQDSQLLFHGPVMAQFFNLNRNAVGATGSSAQGAEVFIDDGRLRLNPPPGFQDIASTLPIYH